MRFDDLRPCDFCHQAVAGKTRDGERIYIDFHRIVLEHHILDGQAVAERLGLTMMLGSERIAGVLASRGDASLPVTRTELLICGPCWIEQDFRVFHDLGDRGKELPRPEADAALAGRR